MLRGAELGSFSEEMHLHVQASYHLVIASLELSITSPVSLLLFPAPQKFRCARSMETTRFCLLRVGHVS